MGHPLDAIKGYASMIKEGDYGPIPEKLMGVVDMVYASSDALTGVVQDFLDISRIEQGRMRYDFSDFDFSKLVSDVATELRPSIEKKYITFSSNIEPGIVVNADFGKLRQVAENLIDNACKYTSSGSITLSLGRGGSVARMSVKGTGVGIKSEVLPKLFQKFSRADDANRANILGTGLGLYVAKQFIQVQKGKIWAESEGEGKGATFVVELPLQMNS